MSYVELDEPILYEHTENLSLTILRYINPENIKYGQMTCKGRTYDFDDGEVTGGREVEVVFDLTENVIIDAIND